MFIQQVNFIYPIAASEILAYQPAGLMGHFFYIKNGNPSPKLPLELETGTTGLVRQNNIREIRPQGLPAGSRDNQTGGDRTNRARM